jgi:NADP-dependent 3-hydroxy acid dehydrogenase YdfG
LVRTLAGKNALVTGASGGLGAHFAAVLASAGARVILTARRQEELALRVAEIRANGGSASFFTLDVADARGIAAAAPSLAEVDILVNNAGVVRARPAL